ncbi:hypothetical protein ACSQ76_22100 [Roseovarius sp. B08]|uniref:hypothetical protein n=1 Tax=Roseovarius sp. B08 TaxID=3449223 RepID=UPI003EDC0F75
MAEYKGFRYAVMHHETDQGSTTGVNSLAVADNPMPVSAIGSTIDLDDQVDGKKIKGVVTHHHVRIEGKVSGGINILYHSTDVYVAK